MISAETAAVVMAESPQSLRSAAGHRRKEKGHDLRYSESGLMALVRVPETDERPRGTLVGVHGITRQVEEQFSGWSPLTDRLGWTLVTPKFDSTRFRGFQRLAGASSCNQADQAMLNLLRRLRSENVIGTGPLVLVGYSGGAQFVHRFLLAHPSVAEGAIVAAAGYYTFPDCYTPYPYGLETKRRSLEAGLDRFLSKPILVAVGDDDTVRDRHLRREVWLDAWQGMTRVERAERWAAALTREARRRGLESGVRVVRLAGAGHSFRECLNAGLVPVVEDFLRRAGFLGTETLESARFQGTPWGASPKGQG